MFFLTHEDTWKRADAQSLETESVLDAARDMQIRGDPM